jgi:hypothetical protein
MLTAQQQAIMELRQQGLSSKEVAERLGISRTTEKFVAWYARRKIAAGDPVDSKPRYCVFRFGSYIGVLPLQFLTDWIEKVWAVRQHLPWLADLDQRPEVEILLGGVVQLTVQQARAARKALAGKRKPGIYRIDDDGRVTHFASESAAARALGFDVHAFRQHGHGRGCYWF